MLKIYLNLFIFISTSLFLPLSSATTTVTGDLVYDDATEIISSTGQSYLSWDSSVTLTYEQIIDATTSGVFSNYHIATQSEAYEFYNLSGGTGIDEAGPQVISHNVTGATPSIFGKGLPSLVFGYFISDEENEIGFISPGSGKIILNDNWGSISQSNSTSPAFRTWVLAANSNVTVVPVPAAIWLMGTGLLGLISLSRRKKIKQVSLNIV